jgi:hypothetical protein
VEVTLYILEKNRETLLLVSCFDTSGSITTRMQSNNQSLRMQIRETNLIRLWFSIKCFQIYSNYRKIPRSKAQACIGVRDYWRYK